MGRNPATGASIKIKASQKIAFRAAKELPDPPALLVWQLTRLVSPRSSAAASAGGGRYLRERRHLRMMRPDPVSSISGRPWGARIAISAVFLTCGNTVGAWASQLPRIKEALGMSDMSLSFIVLAFACGSIPVMPLAGALVVRWGGVRTITAASVGSAVGMLMLGLADSFPILLLAALLAGSAIGMLDVSMNAHATAVELAFRRPIMSSIHGWFSLGGLVGAGCGGLLTEHAVSIAVVLGSSGASVLLAGGLGALFLTVAAPGRGAPASRCHTVRFWPLGCCA